LFGQKIIEDDLTIVVWSMGHGACKERSDAVPRSGRAGGQGAWGREHGAWGRGHGAWRENKTPVRQMADRRFVARMRID